MNSSRDTLCAQRTQCFVALHIASYEACKSTRSTVVQETRSVAKREMIAERRMNDAALAGRGDLDREGELTLEKKASERDAQVVVGSVERTAIDSKRSAVEEQFQRLRLALHDPSSISTPADLVTAVLGASERTSEIETQVKRDDPIPDVIETSPARPQGA